MSSLAPVDMLPDDVAFEILRIAYAHSTFPYCGSNRFQLYMNSPIPISHVSRRWRDLVLSLPCLWNCIHIIPSEWRDDVDVVQAYIARSGRLPLSVEFDCRMNDAESDHSESDSDSEGSHDCPCDDVWNALFKERTRWEHLVLDARNAAHLASFTKQISGEVFPALESLQIPSYEPGQDMRVLDITAPKLTQLRATSFYYARTVLHSTPLQLFSRLTTLELVHFFYDVPNHVVRFLDMLRSASATLQVLVLRHGCFNVPIPSASLGVMPTDFPHLTFLVIESVLEYHDADYNIVSELCRAARSLDRVHILGHSIMSFHSYLHSGTLEFPTVRHLRYYIPDETAWTNFIPAFPLLEELQISGGDPTSALRAAMSMDDAAARGDGAPAWPCLRTLVLLGPNEYIALRFMQHRARVGRPLADVTYAGWFSAQAKRTFQALNATFTPTRNSPAFGEDYTKDWIEYWLTITGELDFSPWHVLSPRSFPRELT